MAREMKNSGVRWIGDIPSVWNDIRLQHCIHEINVKNNPIQTEFVLSLTVKDGVLPYDEKGDVGNKAKENYSEYKLAYPNTIVLNSMNILIGAVGISKYFGCVSPVYYVIRNKENSNLKFINYVLSSIPFQKNLRRYANGILEIRMRVSMWDICKRRIPQPPLSEQKSIADFLDAKCGEIDGLLADLDAEVKTLTEYKKSIIAETVTRGLNPNAPMKSSGILWAESIPAHWGVEKFRYKLKPKKIVGQGDKEVLSVYREYGVVIKSSRDDNHNRTSEDTSNYKYVQPNDFVINKMKAWQGSMGVSNYEGIVSPAYFVYSFRDEDYLPKFFHYYMRNANNIPEYRRLSGGIREGQWDLSPYDLGNMPIILPPIDEQIEIANYLDSKCAAIDQAITDKTQQIETLKAYKSSLIYEYVTGKKQVL